jgi:hypothetical protein
MFIDGDALQQIEEDLTTFPLKWTLSSYTEDELKILEDVYTPYEEPYLHYPYTIKVIPITLHMDKSTIEDAMSTLKRPLEDMPLLINDFTDARLAFVKWRLMIGR